MPGPTTESLRISGDYHRLPNARPAVFAEPQRSPMSYDVISGKPDEATFTRLNETYQREWWDFPKGMQRPNHTKEYAEFLKDQKNLVTIIGHNTKEVISIAYGGTEVREHPFQDEATARLSGIAVVEDLQSRNINDGNRESFGVGTDTMRAFNHEMKASGHKNLVLTYDEPSDKFYQKQFMMQHTDERRAKVGALLARQDMPHAQDPHAPIIREADLRVPEDARTVLAYERAQPQFRRSNISTKDAVHFLTLLTHR